MKKLRLSGLAGVVTLVSTVSLAQQPYAPATDNPPPAWFVDVASKAGIIVRNVNGNVESKHFIIEATGSGVAILDYDADGWPDIFLVYDANPPDAQAQYTHDYP